MESCVPGLGNTYLTIGQDLFSIEEYVTSQYNYSLHNYDGGGDVVKTMSSFAPAATMFYTDLDKLDGLRTPVDYGSGVEYADGIADSLFPDADVGVQIGLWLNGTFGCDKIINEKREEELKVLNDYLETNDFSAVFLRIGYEFDNPFFGYSDSPESYVKAFRHIVHHLRRNLSEQALMKTKFVWHSWAAPRANSVSLEDFYPGDEFVDWIGVSIFQQVFPWSSNWMNGYVDWGGDEADIRQVLQFAAYHGKPTMIAESTPFGGINLSNKNTELFGDTDAWDRWFGRVLSLIETYDIDMWSYINCDWDSQPMWHGVGFGDTRLSSNHHVMEMWQHYIIESKGNQTFLLGNSLSCESPTTHTETPPLKRIYPVFHREVTFHQIFHVLVLVFFSYTFVLMMRKVYFSFQKNHNQGTPLERTPIMKEPYLGRRMSERYV